MAHATLDEAIRTVIGMGFDNVTVQKYTVSCVNSRDRRRAVTLDDPTQFGRIDYEGAELELDHEGQIQFNGMSFEDWKEQL